MSTNEETMRRVYLDAQNACGLKKGDRVKVVRKAETGEAGWGAPWLSDMDSLVGMTGQITCFNGVYGIGIDFPDDNGEYYLPYFALEEVDKSTPVFKPFDRVLVRDDDKEEWRCGLFSHESEQFGHYKFACSAGRWKQCIPYRGNEHLTGTCGKFEAQSQ